MRAKSIFFIASLVGVAAGYAPVARGVSNIRFTEIYNEDYELPPGVTCGGPNPNWRCADFTGARSSAVNFHNQMASVGVDIIGGPYSATSFPGVYVLQNIVFDRIGVPWTLVAEDMLDDSDIAYVIGHSGAWCVAPGDPIPPGCPSRCCGASMSGAPLSYTFTPPNGATTTLDSTVFTKRMTLGDEGRGLSVLSLLGCAMLAPTVGNVGFTPPGFGEPYEHPVDEDIIPRWEITMRAGLRYVTSTWNSIWIDNLGKIGTNYAKYLKAGRTIADSWRTALFDGDGRNDPAVYATGTDMADCVRRLDGMTMNNFNTSSMPRLQNNAIGYYCFRAWW